MLAAVVAHSSETATPSMTVQNKAQEMQGTIIRGTLPVSPSTESESGADPTAAKVCACLFHCHGKIVMGKCTQYFVFGVQAATYLVIDYGLVNPDIVLPTKADSCYGL